ncbi:L,D-transpeptidase [Priestia megaterium]|uniref:L,D-transpeptidase n=1 Tax=Priestia megaterium TaxID=1404 RepID=UPI00240EF9A4|nr:L,D-transpeptidase [Priestia megaterium]
MNANGTYGDTYGIHGNNNESSIWKYVSQGCVRMDSADIEKLYDKVEVGTPVAIT